MTYYGFLGCDEVYKKDMPYAFNNPVYKEYLYREIKNFEDVRSLYMKEYRARRIPRTVLKMINLESIDIYGNFLEEFPYELTQIKALKYINARENLIKSISSSIGNLENLLYLKLVENKLEYLPDEFCLLKSLKYLHIGDNKLKVLPLNFHMLDSLEQLAIDSQFNNIFPQICYLKNLRTLSISPSMHFKEKDKLKYILPEIKLLQKLNYLSLSGNDIETLPDEISDLKNLKVLNLQGNKKLTKQKKIIKEMLPNSEIQFNTLS